MQRTRTPLMWKAGAALLALALAVALLPGAALAQASGGTLFGRVTDGSGGALPGATVTATNRDTGFNRVVVTDSEGFFRIPSLPAGSYDVRVELSGFGEVAIESVRVNVATERELEVSLQSATVEETITVVDEAPLVATEPSIGTVVSQQELENLPLNGRQFANLATLAPGTSLGVNPDPTKPNQLVVALNGGIGRNVNYQIDGGDNTDDTIGGALQNFNLEAVQEFKIQTQQYKAEFGRSTGGVLSVVTKTGTNEWGGSVFGFFRDKSLNAKTEREERQAFEKQDYERQQYGGSLGGPLVRDRAHLFATYERTDRDTAFLVNTRGIFPTLDNTSFPLPFEDNLFTAKATWDLSERQYVQARFGMQDTKGEKYAASPLSTPANLGTISSEYYSLLLGHTAQIGAESLNEFLFQWSDFDNAILPDSTAPTQIFPNGVAHGQNVNTPQSTVQEKWQFKDDFGFSTTLGGRRHDFKAGVNYIHVPTLGGGFSAGTNGWYFHLGNDANSPIREIQVFGGQFKFSTPVEQYSVYLQDDWSLTDRLTLNLGMRYDYWDGFDLDQRSNPIWRTLSTQTQYNEGYLRDFRGGRGGELDNDDDNFGPRLGFTYDVKGDARHLVRGGWGIYHDFPYTNATILFPTAAVQSNYGLAYFNTNATGIRNPDGTFFRLGQPLPPNLLPGSSVFPPNEVASPTLATPKATQASIGYSAELSRWLGVSVDLVSIRYRDVPFRFRANPVDPTTGRRRFPQFGNFRLWYGDGRADYDGINLGVRSRISQALELQGFYTYSEAEGNVLAGADEFRITATGYQRDLAGVPDQSVNPLDPLCGACIGPLNTDSRHRVTLSAVYRAPWQILVAGILRYRSATPYTEWTGQDTNRDSYAFELAPGVPHVNSRRGDSFSQVDLRLSREFGFANGVALEVIGEVFNLFNEENPAGFIGNRTANNFGQPTVFAGDPGQGEQRLGQLGLRLRF